MALPDLAATADLSARGVTPTAVHTTMLTVASTLVRQAAASPVLEHTATIQFGVTEASQWLDLPVKPVRSVSAILLDGEAFTGDYKLVDNGLWSRCGWAICEPVVATVTLVCGLPTVPDDIVQLVCDLAILGADSATSGAIDPRVVAESIDDYSVTFAKGAEVVASAMTIPAMTRHSLRARFGGGTGSLRLR